MKKWIFISFILLLVISGFAIETYRTALKPIRESSVTAEQIARREAGVSTITDSHIYYGHGDVGKTVIVYGKDEQSKNVIVFIPENGEVFLKRQGEGISVEDVKKQVQQERRPKEILSVTLGLDSLGSKNKIPLWEIKYVDEENRLNYIYYDFKTGEFLKRYSI